ncbi:MAG: N-6 DNA methylase [Candidatus Aenigmatarchaeota archaeon]
MELSTTFLSIKPNEIADEIKKNASEAKTEEDLRIRIEHLLRSRIFDKYNIPWAFYEHKTKKISAIKPGRKDALYGRVIIEYEAPGKLKNESYFREAKNQVKRYIEAEAVKKEEYTKYFGVVIDGYSIAFIRFRKGKWEEPLKPADVNEQTISTFLRAISGLQRKPIDAEYLLLDFGPRSELSKRVILNLYEKLLKSKSNRTKMLFEDWKRVFSQVCAYSKEKLIGLIEYYGLQEHKIVDVEKLMFAVHTYYTLLMKFLTSEIVSYFNIPYSFLTKLEASYYKSLEELLSELKDLEEGGIIAKIGIRNFLEADYFAWYLDEWDKSIAELIMEVVRKLREYEPGTAELEPDRIKDLFKRLYQNLVPKKVRHDLGEYFTPDWLAELLLNEVGYEGNPDKRILDPACGSGTFLVLSIKRIKEYAEQNFITDKKELLLKIINNVVGIDLNPLAVLASRANYIIALGDLIRAVPKEGIEIPVYLADSILVSRGVSVFTGKPELVLETSVAKFWVREEIIKKNLWEPLLNSIEFCLKNKYTISDFKKYINELFVERGFVTKDAYGAIVRLYEQFLNLEKRKLDGIWTKVIKNSFAPMLIGQFDYVVGNPPWVNWNNLPERYRELLKKLFDEYKILPEGPYIPRVDISMLFLIDVWMSISRKMVFLAS